MSAPVVRTALAAAAEREAIPAAYQLEAAKNAHLELARLDADGAGASPRAVAVAMKLLDLLHIERLEAANRRRKEHARARAQAAGRARAVAIDYDPRTVRAWAKATGHPCPTRGRYLPADVLDAYRAAQQVTP